jgi:drug/metabolite transporter (DMT)-like permease
MGANDTVGAAEEEAMSANLRGVLWMAGTVLSFCAMAVAARQLLRHMGTFEILFFRTGVAWLLVLALAARAGPATLKTRRLGLHVWRNGMHLLGQSSWVYALSLLPLATVFAIEFTSPIWTAVLAVWLLGERMNRGRAAMLALGLAGVLAILRPGLGVFQPAALVMLVGSLAFAIQFIATKQLSSTESPLAVLFWMSAVQTPVCLLVSLPGWSAPVLADLPWILAIGVGSFTAHYCMMRAMKLADATVVVPVDFFRLPLIAVVGALFYGEAFDPAVFLGAALIVSGVWINLAVETRARRARLGPE